ncbi:MAG: nucleotide exchange factor GrpE [Candidatus Kariarchaeaceae archaeon]|jgi:molecular chaperone GrpE
MNSEEQDPSKEPELDTQTSNEEAQPDQNQSQDTQDRVSEESEVPEEPEEPVEMVEVAKNRLEELELAEAKFIEDLKRERAEGINYRKRLQKQRDEFAEIASAQILSKVLVAFDDLNRVIDNANGEIPEGHMEGISLVKQRLQGIFEQEGVSLIKVEEGKTRYNPSEMEAVVSQPIEGVEPNTVMGLIAQGFKKGDRVLRPAKVMISKAVAQPVKEETKSETSENPNSSEDNSEN